MAKKIQNNPKVLGLDISTKTIGWSLFDIVTQELLEPANPRNTGVSRI